MSLEFFYTDTNQIEASIAEEDYQALTDKEEKDLERLLSESDNALGNAEKFMEQLSKELSLLDGVIIYIHNFIMSHDLLFLNQANIQSLMGSEAQIMQLLSLLEKAENEAAGIENELESYENMLAQARVAMATVGEKNLSSLEIANRNYRLLLMELNNLVVLHLINHQLSVHLFTLCV